MDCSICLNKLSESPDASSSNPPDSKRQKLCYQKNNSRNVSTPCGHVFHRSCIEGWLKKIRTCPKCRKAITISSLRPLFLEFGDDESKPKSTEKEVSPRPEGKHNSQKDSKAPPSGSYSKSTAAAKPKSDSNYQMQSQSMTLNLGNNTLSCSQSQSQSQSQTFSQSQSFSWWSPGSGSSKENTDKDCKNRRNSDSRNNDSDSDDDSDSEDDQGWSWWWW
ncbi:ERAD-associated E3 ubiquitin-protein ligase HRD1 [Orchesella cincta]|uniref:ERAD-associated E3 ubiquitin-protein ligase HRD1 n=1 Tax=Orchesella cincta TaxID=48709 RepID=A0A1D2N297_ORCCI|nr:ERAD-associated E3 ubiquitin-protein ligase HRD1 [Orchesella cincta]